MMNIFLKYKTIILYLYSFFLGVLVSGGLLNYSGKELVNILYFIFFVIFVPFFITVVTLVTKRVYPSTSLAGVLFSLGALLSLVVTAGTRDLAFGWATTFDVSDEEFYHFVNFFAIWKSFLGEFTPSLELVKLSHFTRLGSSVSVQQIEHAKLLGQWWRYLFMMLVVYGVIFRSVVYIISIMIEPKRFDISFVNTQKEEEFKPLDEVYENSSSFKSLKDRSFRLVGYHLDTSALGLNSSPKANDIVIAVKSYEPPMLEFFDFLVDIEEQNPNSKKSLLLTGLNGKKPLQKDIDIWKRKIKELGYDYLEVIS